MPPATPSGLIPTSISDSGTIAGYYYDAAGAHIFELKGTTFIRSQIAGMTNVFPVGINNGGQITIQGIDTGGTIHAFLKHGPSLVELTPPGATETD